jgi:serine kinase of HPr protein (carbohydrate metabolism regulator)
MTQATAHASAVQVGDHAVLIRGPSGAGKSRLALALILAGRARQIPAATLIGDDRIALKRLDDRLLACAVPDLRGLLEVRGLGIRRCDSVESAPIGLVVDLHAPDAERLPAATALTISLEGIVLPRVPVGEGYEPLPLVIAALIMPDALTTA